MSLPAGAKFTADMVQTDEQFWYIFRFRFLSGKGFSKADSDAGIPCAVISAVVARQLFGTTEVAGQILQLNHVDYRLSLIHIYIVLSENTAQNIFGTVNVEGKRCVRYHNQDTTYLPVIGTVGTFKAYSDWRPSPVDVYKRQVCHTYCKRYTLYNS